MNALKMLMDSQVRIERKLDELLRLRMETAQGMEMVHPLNATGQTCPLCKRAVQYSKVPLDDETKADVRSCGCSTDPLSL